MKIPFSPPFINQAVIDEVTETLKSNWITTGPKVAEFEQRIKEFTSSDEAICVNSWTSGAIMMLKWFGIKEGDEVIIPAYTYCATALSVLHCGATPVMVDVDDDFNISPGLVYKAITSRTKAIIAVDIAGWPCCYEQLAEVIARPEITALFKPQSEKQAVLGRILLVADAAHSFGATINGAAAARKSDVAIFSFHAVKNITTAEGGCICLNLPASFDSAAEHRHLKMYTLNGQTKDAFAKSTGAGWKYDILFPGLKINMPDVCAAIGLAQLKIYKQQLLPLRKRIALNYAEKFKNFPWFIAPPLIDAQRESSYHLFALRINDITEQQRDMIIDEIVKNGVAVNVHFIPLPMLTLFKNLGYKIEDYPSAYNNYSTEISLPIYPGLSASEVDFIVDTVARCVGSLPQYATGLQTAELSNLILAQ